MRTTQLPLFRRERRCAFHQFSSRRDACALTRCRWQSPDRRLQPALFGTPSVLTGGSSTYAPVLATVASGPPSTSTAGSSAQIGVAPAQGCVHGSVALAGDVPNPATCGCSTGSPYAGRTTAAAAGRELTTRSPAASSPGFVSASSSGNVVELHFQPLTPSEAPEIGETGFLFRRTYKVKVDLSPDARVAEVECLTDST